MIKASKYLIIVASAIMTLAGCANEDNAPEIPGSNGSPTFSATIDGSRSSRAYGRSWESGDEIGVTGASRSNVPYLTNDGLGSFSVKTVGEQIYFPDENEVTFTAYYPWNDLTEGASTIQADTKTQARQKSFDFLWAQASGRKAAPAVVFNFAHKMAKVVITLRCGDYVNLDEITNARLSLNGVRHTGSFNVSDGTTTVNADKEADWAFTDDASNAPVTIDETSGTVTYTLIFLPQEFDESLEFTARITDGNIFKTNIDFTAANSGKDGSNAKNQWVESRQYNLSLTLHRTAISLSKCVILPWNEVNGQEIAD